MKVSTALAVVALAIAAAGCATSQEWADWRQHPTHFASNDHLFFSVRNREGAPTRVTRADLERARDQSWWGRPITVEQSAIVER
jgi:hypothetical protein